MNATADDVTKKERAIDPRAGLCSSCDRPYLRKAKWREGDGMQLLALRWPVRCMNCLKRDHIPIWKARYAMPLNMAHSGKFGSQATWQDYTGAGGNDDAARVDKAADKSAGKSAGKDAS